MKGNILEIDISKTESVLAGKYDQQGNLVEQISASSLAVRRVKLLRGLYVHGPSPTINCLFNREAVGYNNSRIKQVEH